MDIQLEGSTCQKPKFAWNNPAGGRPFLSVPDDRDATIPDMLLPCGQCSTCAQANAKQWSIRAIHEMQYHARGCAITLTFSEQGLEKRLQDPKKPMKWSLYKSDLQHFIKKLRAYEKRRTGVTPKFKFLGAGEYGSQNHRPHYHLAIFGWEPYDVDWKGKSTLIQTGKSEQHFSQYVTDLWSFGHTSVGLLTPESAGYIAGYTAKKYENKRTGRLASINQEGIHIYTHDEFILSSKNPAIGYQWWLDNYKEICALGYITNATGERAYKYPIPRTYIRWLEKLDPDLYEKLKDDRLEFIEESHNYNLLQQSPQHWELAQAKKQLYLQHKETKKQERPL
jgi:hypothetical protein